MKKAVITHTLVFAWNNSNNTIIIHTHNTQCLYKQLLNFVASFIPKSNILQIHSNIVAVVVVVSNTTRSILSPSCLQRSDNPLKVAATPRSQRLQTIHSNLRLMKTMTPTPPDRRQRKPSSMFKLLT
eukprot:m.331874 g.331874  ORF g.331874 m.331874 type:complete len:127 (+) comp16806_c0_seq1:741-1121(+)